MRVCVWVRLQRYDGGQPHLIGPGWMLVYDWPLRQWDESNLKIYNS